MNIKSIAHPKTEEELYAEIQKALDSVDAGRFLTDEELKRSMAEYMAAKRVIRKAKERMLADAA